MRPKIQFPKGTAEKIEKLLQVAKNLNEYKRIQCVYFRAKFDFDANLIVQITGYKLQTVRNIHSAFLKQGIKALKVKQKGGRYNSVLTFNEEKKFIQEFDDKAKKGGIIEVSRIHKAYEEKAKQKVAKSTVYRMLDRHNWRKITPRPSHPKSSIEIMEQFKKTSNT
jgi:transposase